MRLLLCCLFHHTYSLYDEKKYTQKLSSCYLDMILKAWGIFYSKVEQNLDYYNNYEKMEKEYNSIFMEKLNQWIPSNCN